MERLFSFINRLLYYWRRKQFDRDLEEEMRFHMDMKFEDNLRNGASVDQARHITAKEFGNQTLLRERSRDMWAYRSFETLVHDLRYGLRTLMKNPGFTLVATLSLALGIGANTAIFSLIDSIMLKTLSVKDPHRLVIFSFVGPKSPSNIFDYPLFERFRQNTQAFDEIIAASGFERMKMIDDTGHSETVSVEEVSGNLFSTLGVGTILGRPMTVEDDKPSSAEPIAVITYEMWQRNGMDPSIIGKKIVVNNCPLTIVGVAPQGFAGFEIGRRPDMWVPINLLPVIDPKNPDLTNKGSRWIRIVGRIKPSVTVAQATAEMDAIYKQDAKEYIARNPQMYESNRRVMEAQKIKLEDGSAGFTYLRRQFGQQLLILMTIVGLVLLLACANVANLLLARSASRQKEIAVRLAIGAGRWRLIRQLLTESLLLSMIGGLLGLLFAHWGTRLLLTYMPKDFTLGFDRNPDAHLLAFTLSISLITGVLFGLAPALRTTKLDLTSALKDQSAGVTGRSRLALNKILITVQVALSLFLLIGAGLFVRTLQNLRNIELGLNSENLVQFELEFDDKAHLSNQDLRLFKQLIQRLDTIPGVSSSSVSTFAFLSGNRMTTKVIVPGYSSKNESDLTCHVMAVSPRFFETTGMTLLAGRGFSEQDELPAETRPAATDPAKPAAARTVSTVITQMMATRFFPNENPLGKRFTTEGSPRQFEVVGVVKDVRYSDMRDPFPQTFFYPMFQGKDTRKMNVGLRTAGNIAGLITSVRGIVNEIDSEAQMGQPESMTSVIDDSIVQERLMAQLTGFFSMFALLIACIGLYGILSYSVSQRTNEIGIRMALGAQTSDVIFLVMREMSWLIAIGLAAGLGGALATTRLISTMLFGIGSMDPTAIIFAIVSLTSVAIAACYFPARNASRTDPMVALRCE